MTVPSTFFFLTERDTVSPERIRNAQKVTQPATGGQDSNSSDFIQILCF